MTTRPDDDTTTRLLLLGSTGSIGRQALDVVTRCNRARAERGAARAFEVVGLAAGHRAHDLAEQARALGVDDVALADGNAAPAGPARVRRGPDAAEQLVREIECDIVLGAIVGEAGLPATLAALELGRDVALANKETLVAAGAIVVDAARRHGALLLPVDSEHAGVWQCLRSQPGALAAPPLRAGPEIRRVTLTASGGALRDASRAEIREATPAQALAHPTWEMGAKVTIDSATLMNKALELIEASWLFGLGADRLAAVIHPQSVVHALVEFADASVVAQLGLPDMRGPIHHALTRGRREELLPGALDLAAAGRLDFHPPDLDRFPALGLGFRVIETGGTAGAVLNAANEAAVAAFLEGAIRLGRVVELAIGALDAVGASAVRDLDDVRAAGAEARAYVAAELAAAPPAAGN